MAFKCPQGSSVVFRRNQNFLEKECFPCPEGCIRRNSKENLADVGDEKLFLSSVIHSDEGSWAGRSHEKGRLNSLLRSGMTQYSLSHH